MRVFTSTPVAFRGDRSFFFRDSGLFSNGLESLGIESMAVMPEPAGPDDDVDRLIRAPMASLRDPSWWAGHSLDAVVLYSWAAPKFNGIAWAIKDSGTRLLVYTDTCGLVSLRANPRVWLREWHHRALAPGLPLLARLKGAGNALAEVASGRVARERLRHYEAADIVAAVTPYARRWLANEATVLGRPDLAARIRYLPHPQSEIFHFDGSPKMNRVICIGRWHREDWPQKNPETTVKAMERFLEEKSDWTGLILGSGAGELPGLLGNRSSRCSGRLEYRDSVPVDDLPAILNQSKIGFWASRWEGQQGTAAQALCCGCSVVSAHSAQMSCFRHYVSRNSGRLAPSNKPGELAEELCLEADAWERGERDPRSIADNWTGEFHSANVAREGIRMLGLMAS